MRLSFDTEKRLDLNAIHAALMASSIPGITGVSSYGEQLHVEIPSRDSVSEAEEAAIAQVIQAHANALSWDEVRRTRAPMLLDVDWRVQRAEDNGEDAASLRAYRQALRDITKQSNPEQVTWPERPW